MESLLPLLFMFALLMLPMVWLSPGAMRTSRVTLSDSDSSTPTRNTPSVCASP